ncbi:MAG: Mth938-like domain-containing protein [Thermoplasmata archaeon]
MIPMEMIDSYEFGRIVIDGREFRSDVIIDANGVDANWWRKEGHALCVEDLQTILKRHPKTLIVGTGYSGLVKVRPEVIKKLESSGIQLIVERTTEACREYNERAESEGVVAALHLTC